MTDNVCHKDALFVLLTAPAGWGKTSLLFELYSQKKGLWLYLSPLRALAQEMEAHCRAKKIPCSQSLSEKLLQGIFICTPESLREDWVVSFYEKIDLVIFDEIHLFFDWGDSFRPLMLERFYLIGSLGLPILGISASMGESLIGDLRKTLFHASYEFFHLNFGDLQFQFAPIQTFLVKKKEDQIRIAKYLLLNSTQNSFLIFCRFRREVDEWSEFCCRHKISFCGAVGGETKVFQESLKKNSQPRLIASTETLSHGVNLPVRRWVFLSYPEKRERFWLQMSARGGRDGEGYRLVCSNLIDQDKKKKVCSWLKGAILSCLCYKNLCAQLLREFFFEKFLFKNDIL